MDTKQYTTIDKTEWPRGAWDEEPDKLQWQDEVSGLPCLIVRSHTGALCGYAGVPPSHPWHGKDYDAVCVEIEVHGGLTFASECQRGHDESRGVCHVPGPGEPDHIWWFGFDCGHCFDIVPAYPAAFGEAEYRDLAYVRGEVTQLAAQLAQVQR